MAKPAQHALPISPLVKTGTGTRPADFIPTEVGLLQHADPKVQGEARKRLIDAVLPPAGQAITAQYAADYATDLNTRLAPLFQNPEMRVRLNAAIVLERVAAAVYNDRLAPSATAACNDKLEPIVLWGVKSSKYIIAQRLIVPASVRNNQFIESINRAVKAFPKSGPIAEEAYAALTFLNERARNVPVPANSKMQVVPAVVKLLQDRTAQYKKVDLAKLNANANPEGLPPTPQAENDALTFFSTEAWPACKGDPAKKQQMAQAILDLLTELARVSPAVQKKSAGAAEDEVWKDDLLIVMKRCAGAMKVIINDHEKLADPTKAVQNLTAITFDTPENQVVSRIEAVATLLRDGGLLPAAPGAPAAPAGNPSPAASAAAPASAK